VSAPIVLTMPEKVEIHRALELRVHVINHSISVIEADKNPRAYDAQKAAWLKSLEHVESIRKKVRV